jgi:hypothetical protein
MTAPRPLPHPSRAAPPAAQRPWPNLPPETQIQIAHLVGDLLRPMVPRRDSAQTAHAERGDQR